MATLISARATSAASYTRTKAPTSRELHMMKRFGQGHSRALFQQMRAAGGETAWFEQQLDPDAVPQTATALAVPSWFPALRRSATTKRATDSDGSYNTYEYATDLANYTLQMRINSARPLFETMVDFWSTHLHVNARDFPSFVQRYSYDEMLRENALGTFEDLLIAATTHPAMLMFLDNCESVKNRPNENHGRELLELHTVGRVSGYTETMVKDSAKILSGWTIRSDYDAYYDPNRHTTGAVSVLDFQHPNTSADGEAMSLDYLRYLARHELTARTVCRKLAVRFVSDDPPAALVDELVRTYLSSGTDIKAVLRTLVGSEVFWASVGQKVRSPVDDVVASVRALGVQVKAPTGRSSFAHELSVSIKSVKLFQWPRPDGPPDTADAWCSASRMLASWRNHWGLAGGYWPDGQAVYRKPASYLPQDRIRFDLLVDHVSRTVLGKPSTDRLLQAACEGLDVPPGEIVTAGHKVVKYRFNRLLAVLLDSPEHMSR